MTSLLTKQIPRTVEHSEAISISGRSINDEMFEMVDNTKSKYESRDDDNNSLDDCEIRSFNPQKTTRLDAISVEGSHLEFDGLKPKKAVKMVDSPGRSEDCHEHFTSHSVVQTPFQEFGRTFFLVCIWILMVGFLASTDEKKVEKHQLVVPKLGHKLYNLPMKPNGTLISFQIEAPFLADPKENIRARKNSSRIDNRNKDNSLVIFLRLDSGKALTPNKTFYVCKPEEIDFSNTTNVDFSFDIGDNFYDIHDDDRIQVVILSNFSKSSEQEKLEVPIVFSVDFDPLNKHLGVLFAAFTLILLYALIVWEVSSDNLLFYVKITS